MGWMSNAVSGTVNTVGQAWDSGTKAASDGTKYVAEKTVDVATEVAETTVDVVELTHDTAVDAGEAVVDTAVDAGEAVVDTAVDVGEAVVEHQFRSVAGLRTRLCE